MEDLAPTITVIATILLVGLALGTSILNGQNRPEQQRLVAVGNEMARLGGLPEGLGRTDRATAPDAG